MEIPGVLDTMEIGSDKDVLEVLKQAVGEENIIFESEAAQDSEETEIEEIIEIIEEVEEIEETSQDYTENTSVVTGNIKEEQNGRDNVGTEKSSKKQIFRVKEESMPYESDEERENVGRKVNERSKPAKKQVIQYDVDEDWEDDEMEQLEELDEDMDHSNSTHTSQQSYSREKKPVNNQMNTFSSHFSKGEVRDSNKSKIVQEFGNNVHTMETDSDVTDSHEIVKNVENNLLYTVLGSKKSVPSTKASSSDAQYIQMEQLNENTIPVEGTIYYEGDNMETLYVAQSVDENEQYQYDASMDQEEQVWEGTNSDTTQNQEEENSQDQIFLHEDEDGQLYFKDDNGELQPVYLTEDGNYAIADTSDDQDSKGSQGKSVQAKSPEEYVSPEPDVKPTFSNKQSAVVPASALNDIDNEDNTVTISLIISEDEHGQKRTQVIIPTTDTLKCDICNKSFKTSFQLLRHNRLKHAREEDITTRNFPCDLCPKRYPDQNSLARHRKTHTGDRPFQCLECHKNFPTAPALRRHLSLHNSQSRPLPCIYCGRRFQDKSSLAKHEQSHLAADQRTHVCDICQKSFSDATDLSLHKKYHDPDKKFDCEVCGREFNRLNNLQRHMMVHQQQGANEEILSCDVCGITYKFMSSLTRHMVTTHMNPEKMRQQAEEQRRKRENNYRRYLENRKMYETQHSGNYGTKRNYHSSRIHSGSNDEAA